MYPFVPKYSVSVEYTFVCFPLSWATSVRYLEIRLSYPLSIGWPAGCQKIGVTTTGPVVVVPMTGPLCQIRGGLPLAALSVLTQPRSTGVERMIPPKCPDRGDAPAFAVHALDAASAEAPPAPATPMHITSDRTTNARTRTYRFIYSPMFRSSVAPRHRIENESPHVQPRCQGSSVTWRGPVEALRH